MPRAVGKPSALVAAVIVSLALATLSLLLPSGPGYDQYQWLIWGRELIHLNIVTDGSGTSWKPLPALVAALLSPLGGGQADGWLVIGRAGGLLAIFMAFRVAVRLASPRYAWLAGIAAAGTLLFTHRFVREVGIGDAESLTAALVLLAIERHLDGRRGQAFALGVAAGLMRPEIWPFLLVYGARLWSRPERLPRWRLVAGGSLIPLLWFGGDWLGSGRLFTASATALRPLKNTPGSATHPALAVAQEAWRMLPLPARVVIPATVAAALATWYVDARRGGRASQTVKTVLSLAAAALAWAGLVALMAERGYAGVPRFLFPADALVALIAGIGVARAASLVALPSKVARPAVAMALLAIFVVLAAPDASRLPSDAAADAKLARQDDGLAEAVTQFGGPQAVLACGRPYTGWWSVTALAYDLGVEAGVVEDQPHGRSPVVFLHNYGVASLHRALPRRHMRVAGSIDGWEVIDRCQSPARSGAQPAPRSAVRAGSRTHARRAVRT